MKTHLNTILTVLSLITVMSIASCKKQEPETFLPEVTKAENFDAIKTASDNNEPAVRYYTDNGNLVIVLLNGKTISCPWKDVSSFMVGTKTINKAHYSQISFLISNGVKNFGMMFVLLPFEETFLLDAAQKTRLMYYEKTWEKENTKTGKVQCVFENEIRVDSLNTSFKSIDIDKVYIKESIEDGSNVEFKFQDNLASRFSLINAGVLEVAPASELFAYVNDAFSIPFKVKSDCAAYISDIQVNCEVEGNYNATIDPETGSGEITVCIKGIQDESFPLTLILNDGHVETEYVINITEYYLRGSRKEYKMAAEAGSAINLAEGIETNIPEGNYEILATVNGDVTWLNTSGAVISAVSENDTEYYRTAKVTLSDKAGHFPSFNVITVTQDPLPVVPIDGMVYIPDVNFKRALLAVADANKDNQVSLEEAETMQELVLVGKGIHDLTGIEAFKNLWKLDLQNNDIEDGTVIRELHSLYWLDLKGNKNLKTFDVTGCTVFFTHCEFEVTEDLLYYTTRQQVNIINVSDPYCKHSKHVFDERRTQDWSEHLSVVKVKEHTKGDGAAFVFAGLGFIDVDFQDGSYMRMMQYSWDMHDKYFDDFKNYLEYFDVYIMKYALPYRDVYNYYDCSVPESDEKTETRLSCTESWRSYKENMERSAFEVIYGKVEENYTQKMIVWITSLNPIFNFYGGANFIPSTHVEYNLNGRTYNPVFSVETTLHRGMSEIDENAFAQYGSNSSNLEETFQELHNIGCYSVAGDFEYINEYLHIW